MTIEEKLKDLILSKYNSVSEFTRTIDMPNSTLDSIFKRGIGNSSVTNVIKICKALGISADALADGEILAVTPRSIDISERIEVKDVLDNAKHLIIHGGAVTLDGEPIGVVGIDSILDAMDIGLEMAKRKAKA